MTADQPEAPGPGRLYVSVLCLICQNFTFSAKTEAWNFPFSTCRSAGRWRAGKRHIGSSNRTGSAGLARTPSCSLVYLLIFLNPSDICNKTSYFYSQIFFSLFLGASLKFQISQAIFKNLIFNRYNKKKSWQTSLIHLYWKIKRDFYK